MHSLICGFSGVWTRRTHTDTHFIFPPGLNITITSVSFCCSRLNSKHVFLPFSCFIWSIFFCSVFKMLPTPFFIPLSDHRWVSECSRVLAVHRYKKLQQGASGITMDFKIRFFFCALVWCEAAHCQRVHTALWHLNSEANEPNEISIIMRRSGF